MRTITGIAAHRRTSWPMRARCRANLKMSLKTDSKRTKTDPKRAETRQNRLKLAQNCSPITRFLGIRAHESVAKRWMSTLVRTPANPHAAAQPVHRAVLEHFGREKRVGIKGAARREMRFAIPPFRAG
ncbi:MAG: hypothetical protein KAS72_01740 [Phycisphaerales bacterium]|nr:hypothetical protein [Phycisphaerales bacterium]